MTKSGVYSDLAGVAIIIGVFVVGLIIGDGKGRIAERERQKELPTAVFEPKLISVAKEKASEVRFRCQSESLMIFTDRGRVAFKEGKPENVPSKEEIDKQMDSCAKIADESLTKMMEIAEQWHAQETENKK